MKAEDYRPTNITLEVFPNKIYFLSWDHCGNRKSKLLNKSKAFILVNDMNIDRAIRDEVLAAFKAGVIV